MLRALRWVLYPKQQHYEACIIIIIIPLFKRKPQFREVLKHISLLSGRVKIQTPMCWPLNLIHHQFCSQLAPLFSRTSQIFHSRVLEITSPLTLNFVFSKVAKIYPYSLSLLDTFLLPFPILSTEIKRTSVSLVFCFYCCVGFFPSPQEYQFLHRGGWLEDNEWQ